MRLGVPREVKDGERRVGLTPVGVADLARLGHAVVVETDAGASVGFTDAAYALAGATIGGADAVWGADVVVKVKELQPAEYPRLRRGLAVLGYAQLGRDPDLLATVLASGTRLLGYETVRDASGGLPLLAPMSRIAGRLAPQAGALALTNERGGAGVLLCGVDTVPAANVVVVGAGEAGREAARIAARLGCHVVVFSRGRERLAAVERTLADAGTPVGTFTLTASAARFADAIAHADLVVGAVLEPGKLSPTLISRAMLRTMRPGSALVDVGIDQGGIAETSRMTRLSDPTYVEEGIVHYCVPNMPSLVARTATLALTAVTFPYVCAIAERGLAGALEADEGLAAGLMTWDGEVAHAGLAADRGYGVRAQPWRRAAPA